MECTPQDYEGCVIAEGGTQEQAGAGDLAGVQGPSRDPEVL